MSLPALLAWYQAALTRGHDVLVIIFSLFVQRRETDPFRSSRILGHRTDTSNLRGSEITTFAHLSPTVSKFPRGYTLAHKHGKIPYSKTQKWRDTWMTCSSAIKNALRLNVYEIRLHSRTHPIFVYCQEPQSARDQEKRTVDKKRTSRKFWIRAALADPKLASDPIDIVESKVHDDSQTLH